jgi:hypothetical protein
MNQKGQSLVEALIALGAAVIIISAITIAVVTSVHNSDYSKYQNLATNYAQQGMEIVKQQSRLDWNNTATYAGTLCLGQGATALPPHPIASGNCTDVNMGNIFVRQIEIQHISPSQTCDNFNSPCCIFGDIVNCDLNPDLCSSRATITVKWTDSKCASGVSYCHKVALDTCLQNINLNK